MQPATTGTRARPFVVGSLAQLPGRPTAQNSLVPVAVMTHSEIVEEVEAGTVVEGIV
jgi:hypothetical protein